MVREIPSETADMPSISKSETKALLDDHREAIREIMFGAWEDWTQAGFAGSWRCKRSRANFMWEQIVARAHGVFHDDKRIKILRKNESYVFLLDETLAFRFKKSDEQGMTANVPTQAAIDFHDPECELPGLPEISRVDIVYVVNKLETAISDILVVGRDKGEITWTFSLLDGADVVALPVRVSNAPEDQGAARRLVRPKLDKASSDQEADGQP
jgi:hypothetical protein